MRIFDLATFLTYFRVTLLLLRCRKIIYRHNISWYEVLVINIIFKEPFVILMHTHCLYVVPPGDKVNVNFKLKMDYICIYHWIKCSVLKTIYSETCVLKPLWRETTCHIRPFSRNIDLHFYIYVLPIKDHLSYKTTFSGPWGSLKTQFSLYSVSDKTVYLAMCYPSRWCNNNIIYSDLH